MISLAQVAILLTAAVVAVSLFRLLKMSSILGFLAAGLVIGPWGLRLITDVSSILHASEFGVVLLLFIIGLELQPTRLWVMRRTVFGLGSVQVVSCSVVGGTCSADGGGCRLRPVAVLDSAGSAGSGRTRSTEDPVRTSGLWNSPVSGSRRAADAGGAAVDVAAFANDAVGPAVVARARQALCGYRNRDRRRADRAAPGA